MKTDGVSELTDSSNSDLPKVTILTMFRVGLFQMGLGMMSLLTLGILNRVMIDELKVPALISAGALAVSQFMAPTRVLFGQLSDAKPWFGYHRTGYVWTGAAIFTIASFLALQVVWQLGNNLQNNQCTITNTGLDAIGYLIFNPGCNSALLWAVVLAVIFGFYGLAVSGSTTPYAALMVDVSDEDNRSQIVSIVWSMLMVGIIIGAIIGGSLLKQLSLDASLETLQAYINRLFIIIPGIVFIMALVAIAWVEKKYSRYGTRSSLVNREDKITLKTALKILTASRQTGLFFTFLLVMTMSLFVQDPVLEPFGGEVFMMTIAQTTQLNAVLGTGTLIGLGATGFLIVPRLGKQKTIQVGCIAAAITSMLIIIAGFTANPNILKTVLLLFGLSSGIITTGAVSLMLDLTAAETAGTFIGAWGLAQAIARGMATLTGGALLDIGKKLFPSLALSYGLVFAVQGLGMLIAIWLLRRVNVKEFRDNSRAAIAAVIQAELD